MIHKGGNDQGAIGIEVALLKAINKDPRRRRGDFDIGVVDAIPFDRNKDLARLPAFRAVLMKSDLSKEVASWVSQTNEEKPQRCANSGVYPILDGGEDGDEDCCCPN